MSRSLADSGVSYHPNDSQRVMREFRRTCQITAGTILGCSARLHPPSGRSLDPGDSSRLPRLIRAVGPGLSTFNLTGLARPQISLYRNNELIATNSGGWGSWDVNANMAGCAGSGSGTGGTGTPALATFWSRSTLCSKSSRASSH